MVTAVMHHAYIYGASGFIVGLGVLSYQAKASDQALFAK
jgi:hypothetical protein